MMTAPSKGGINLPQKTSTFYQENARENANFMAIQVLMVASETP
jgi:hypothetical protein